jgi:hypothetical protein
MTHDAYITEIHEDLPRPSFVKSWVFTTEFSEEKGEIPYGRLLED